MNGGPQRIGLISDATPTRSGKVGLSVISWNIARALAPQLSMVASEDLDESRAGEMYNTVGSRDLDLVNIVVRRPKICGAFLRRDLYSCYRASRWIAVLGQLKTSVVQRRISRLLVAVGADAYALMFVAALRKKLPRNVAVEVQIGDEFLEWSKRSGFFALKYLVPMLESRAYASATQVWATSDGLAKHVEARYGVKARWLPTPCKYAIALNSQQQTQTIVYVGSISYLYQEELSEVAAMMDRCMAGARLLLLTACAREKLPTRLRKCPNVDVMNGLDGSAIRSVLSRAIASIIPYSFAKANEVMVSTSFPTKLIDCLESNCPAVIFAPRWSSTRRIFDEHARTLVAETSEELLGILQSLSSEQFRRRALSEQRMLWSRFFSDEAFLTAFNS